MDLGFVNLGLTLPGDVPREQTQVRGRPCCAARAKWRHLTYGLESRHAWLQAALALLFDALVEELGPAVPQLESWRDARMTEDHGPEKGLAATLDRVVGAWFALSAAGSRGWGSSAAAAATAPTFASGELGAGDFAFPSIVPVYKPPTTLWVRSWVACCSWHPRTADRAPRLQTGSIGRDSGRC